MYLQVLDDDANCLFPPLLACSFIFIIKVPWAVVGHSQHISWVTLLGSAYLQSESPPLNTAAAAAARKAKQVQHSSQRSKVLCWPSSQRNTSKRAISGARGSKSRWMWNTNSEALTPTLKLFWLKSKTFQHFQEEYFKRKGSERKLHFSLPNSGWDVWTDGVFCLDSKNSKNSNMSVKLKEKSHLVPRPRYYNL